MILIFWNYSYTAIVFSGVLEGILHLLHGLNFIAFVIAIILSFIFLFSCVWFVSRKAFYTRFEESKQYGIVIPFSILILIILLSIVCFGELTYFLSDQKYISLKPTPPQNELGALNGFYFWQLFDLIPGIKISEPLQWQVPYTYDDKIMPWLVFVFRVGVIGIVIKQFYKWNSWRKTMIIKVEESNKQVKSGGEKQGSAQQ